MQNPVGLRCLNAKKTGESGRSDVFLNCVLAANASAHVAGSISTAELVPVRRARPKPATTVRGTFPDGGKAGLLIRKHDHYLDITPAREIRRDIRSFRAFSPSGPLGSSSLQQRRTPELVL